jgi:hypothetical protein
VKKTPKIERFERMLEVVEDALWMMDLMMRNAPRQDITFLPDHRTLRHSLRAESRDAAQSFRDELAANKDFVHHKISEQLLETIDTLIRWYFGSRRVYQIDAPLSEILSHIGLPETIPRDITSFAPSFALVLEEPVVESDGYAHDIVFCSTHYHDKNRTLSIMSYSSAYDRYIPLSAKEKRRLENKVGNLPKFRSALERYFNRITTLESRGGDFTLLVERANLDDLFRKEAGTERLRELILTSFRFILYMESNRPLDEEVVTTNVRRPARSGTGPIIGPPELFELKFSFSRARTKHSHRPSAPTGKVMNPHFREGHNRRPPGKRGDPNAEKSVKVPWTIVRADRLQEGVPMTGTLRLKK